MCKREYPKNQWKPRRPEGVFGEVFATYTRPDLNGIDRLVVMVRMPCCGARYYQHNMVNADGSPMTVCLFCDSPILGVGMVADLDEDARLREVASQKVSRYVS